MIRWLFFLKYCVGFSPERQLSSRRLLSGFTSRLIASPFTNPASKSNRSLFGTYPINNKLLHRKSYSFLSMNDFIKLLWDQSKLCDHEITPIVSCRLLCTDIKKYVAFSRTRRLWDCRLHQLSTPVLSVDIRFYSEIEIYETSIRLSFSWAILFISSKFFLASHSIFLLGFAIQVLLSIWTIRYFHSTSSFAWVILRRSISADFNSIFVSKDACSATHSSLNRSISSLLLSSCLFNSSHTSS